MTYIKYIYILLISSFTFRTFVLGVLVSLISCSESLRIYINLEFPHKKVLVFQYFCGFFRSEFPPKIYILQILKIYVECL